VQARSDRHIDIIRDLTPANVRRAGPQDPDDLQLASMPSSDKGWFSPPEIESRSA
jgi:hypothetical protein